MYRLRRVRSLLVLCVLAGVLAAGIAAPTAIGAGVLSTEVSDAVAPDSFDLLAEKPPLRTLVTDRTGATIATLSEQNRMPLTVDEIADSMKAAIIAIEDRGFYDGGPIDPRAVLRAVINNVAGGSLQGASTITQQYVKNLLIHVVHRDDPAGQRAARRDTLARKIREAQLAVHLDQRLSKDEILAGYLNVIQFSGRVYGVAAAAEAYFGTTAAKLTVPQAALLAGMVNNPTAYDPYTHPDAARGRRDVVIDAMVSAGSLPASAGERAKAAPLGILPDGPVTPSGSCMGTSPEAGFFCAYVRSYLESAGFTAEQLATGGYTIRTTMDPRVARASKRAVEDNVPTAQPGVANTFAVIRSGHERHEVLAMVANRDYGTDAARGQRSTNIVAEPANRFGAGSVYKIFTAAAALAGGQAGLHTPLPNPDQACFVPPGAHEGTSCYRVHNSGDHPDPVTLERALATSPNVAFVALEKRVGVPAVIDMARRLGLRQTLAAANSGEPPVTDRDDPRSTDPQWNRPQSEYFRDLLSFTLGSSPVSPLEMANVPATLMSGGVWCPPVPVLSMTDRDGEPVPVPGEPCERVLPRDVADAVMAGLGQETKSGTAASTARRADWRRPDFGKTGTTQENKAATYVGGVNDYAVSSMVFADGRAPDTICPGPPVRLGSCAHGAFGGTVAAPPYFAAMSELLAGVPWRPLPRPAERFLSAASSR
ncbi:transglycosylase domain-containing protein [Amycolatopsis keratiniphila]|uniref:transglycosylase domain-containing protein n=1 Tax=Amycolatopsis keratiniphila TaxID=129921 RepID=UPI00087C18F1|nr:transglycosylase domain-containing protein [Amycolatopsis keratiniphila]OLZ58092.1 penicillin-binding protein [Amycolatopsis keratiniphila subsp. nogabecina]SDU44005.1 Membrane carboxypeptidase (penicillin-binding protein) [Amycolatopsis keratiniphila]